jgi:phosphatidylglycerophosphatase C
MNIENSSNTKQEKHLILFDFDGTITQKDSFWHFLRFIIGDFKLVFGLLGVVIKQVLQLGGFDNATLKAAILSQFFKGKSKNELLSLGEKYFKAQMPLILSPKMCTLIAEYQSPNTDIALVSASIDFWLAPFAKANNMTLICTNLEYKNGYFTGKFATPNCNKEEKALRIKAQFDLNNYSKIVAYGNSDGDKAMFSLANQYFYV